MAHISQFGTVGAVWVMAWVVVVVWVMVVWVMVVVWVVVVVAVWVVVVVVVVWVVVAVWVGSPLSQAFPPPVWTFSNPGWCLAPGWQDKTM